MHVEVYSKTDCPYCKLTKEYLTQHGIPFDEFIFDDYNARQAMYDKFGLVGNQRTVPQIVIDGTRIGGYTDLIKSDVVARFNAGKFDEDF